MMLRNIPPDSRPDTDSCQFTHIAYCFFTEELSGIFVQSISPNSAAELDGRIKVNDQITEVVI